MQMMQPISLPAVVLENDGPCWFCTEKPAERRRTNKEVESPVSPEGKAEGPENSESNDASVLGENLQDRPRWVIKHKVAPEDPIEAGEETDVVPAAHHLLPGNASVNKAAALHKYMLWKGKNTLNLRGPIGYDINNRENGVWLPGNYAVRKNTDFGKNWSKFGGPFKDAYAKEAMKNAGHLQLHDAHPDYNSNVRQTLLDIAEKLDASRKKDETKCPICHKDLKLQRRPPYGLVGRLNRLSREHKKALEYPEKNRKAINSGYVTSSRVSDVYG